MFFALDRERGKDLALTTSIQHRTRGQSLFKMIRKGDKAMQIEKEVVKRFIRDSITIFVESMDNLVELICEFRKLKE